MRARCMVVVLALAAGWLPVRSGAAEKTELESTRFWVLSGDVNALLWVAMGPTAEQMLAFCANGNMGGPIATSHVRLLATGEPEPKTQLTITAEDFPVLVWRVSEAPDFAEDWYDLQTLACADLATYGFLAAGTSDVRFQDHGGGTPPQTEPDVWTFQARGDVADADGNAWFVNHAGRCIWRDLTTTDTLTCQAHVLLSPR